MGTHVSPEEVAYWYFRLNGCFQIENFLIHPDPNCDDGKNQARTEADLIGVRFPWRNEMEMPDDDVFSSTQGRILVYFAEVKTGKCKINGPWSKPKLQNMQRALKAVGCLPEASIADAAKQLYETCGYEDDQFLIRLFALGEEKNEYYPGEVKQVTWNDALNFIYSRFQKYRNCKADHGQWPQSGKQLWEWSKLTKEHRFVEKVIKQFAKPETRQAAVRKLRLERGLSQQASESP